jgi:hypothetical protein
MLPTTRERLGYFARVSEVIDRPRGWVAERSLYHRHWEVLSAVQAFVSSIMRTVMESVYSSVPESISIGIELLLAI